MVGGWTMVTGIGLGFGVGLPKTLTLIINKSCSNYPVFFAGVKVSYSAAHTRAANYYIEYTL